MSKTQKRINYLVIFFVLLAVEILIGLFVRDRFVRPYLGDLLVVGVIYYFIRIIFPEKIRFLALYVFLFAAAVEFLQLLDLAGKLMPDSGIAAIIFGATFDWKDILCYAAGCLIIAAIDFFLFCKSPKKPDCD